ncbi:hypothetical protein F511_20604 [Dorcoceras hygrometricum]|uniref:Uncharacterized protein n=1 Tax=Dorcoceras hygrometricum TaxID=472368 RepID=A0A2Z7A793_9LAMI|nr:hypothetical protein F511_20604 [Dorcoceras hygrometricum]
MVHNISSAVAQRRVKSGQLRRRNDTQLLGCNQRSKWKESMAEIKSCKLQALEKEDGPAGTYKREPAGTSKWTIDDDVIGDDIMFSRCRNISCRKLSAVVKRSAREKRRRTERSISRELQCNQQLVFGVGDCKTMSFSKVYTTAFFLRAKIQQMVLATMDSAEAQRQKNSAEALSEEKISWNDEDQLVHKDGSAAVGSDSTSRRKQQLIQSRASMNQLLLCIQSQDVVPVASNLQRYESSRSDEPAAKQLTIYEELSKLDVNC